MKKLLSVLLLGAMLVATLASCGDGESKDGDSTGTQATTTAAGGASTTTKPKQTLPQQTVPQTSLDFGGIGDSETPMQDTEVLTWMDNHTMLNDKVDTTSYFASQVGFFADGGLCNLFDEIFTNDEWAAAEADIDENGLNAFDRATTSRWDTNGDGYIGDNPDTPDVVEVDNVRDLGKFGFSGSTGAFYWAMTEKVTLGSYVIYTGNDNSTNPNRNPVGWKLYATNDPALGAVPEDLDAKGNSATALKDKDALTEAGWILLDDVFDGAMADADALPFGYLIDEDKQGAYQYYCWFIDYGGDGTSLMQCNGMKLFAA